MDITCKCGHLRTKPDALALSGNTFLAAVTDYCAGPYGGCGYSRTDKLDGKCFNTKEEATSAATLLLSSAAPKP